MSSPVSVARGVKQGDPMSPFLFNLVLDTCLRKLEGGVRLNDALRLNHISFANDVVLNASAMGELQSIFDCYTDALEQIALEIDREILNDLLTGAQGANFFWSRSPF